MRLRNWLMQRAAATPAAPALESVEATLNFAELADRARRGAAWAMATAPGDAAPLAMLLPSGAAFACWFHALALSGRAVLPLNARLTADEIARQLRDADAGWLLVGQHDVRVQELTQHVPEIGRAHV